MTSQDIIDFMLGKNSKEGVEGGTSRDLMKSDGVETSSSPLEVRKSPSTNKKQVSAALAFCKTLVENWLEMDDILGKVMYSISNLRERLWHTSHTLLQETEERQQFYKVKSHQSILHFGYRGTNDESNRLNTGDMHLSLDQDLYHHERMLATLRRCLSSLSQSQEALGRRLDEYHRLKAEKEEHSPQCVLTIEECNDLFVATSRELYRKQALAEQVFNSVNDALFAPHKKQEDYATVDDGFRRPRQIAYHCSTQWSRKNRNSFLLEFELLLDKLQQHF